MDNVFTTKEYKILSIVLGVIVVICLLGFIGYLINRSNDVFAQKYAGIAFGTIVGALLTGFFALKNMMSGNQVKNSLKKINSPEDTKERSIYISAAYVFESKSLGFCQNNEVLLSKGDVEYMKLTSKQ